MTEKTQNKDTINAENDRILINIEQSNEKGQWACEGAKVWQCTRAEAIERMANGIWKELYGDLPKKQDFKGLGYSYCKDYAEAALDALLGE